MDRRLQELEARFELPMLIAALLVIPAIAIEQSSAGKPWDTLAIVLNWSIWLAFALELVVMIRAAQRPGRWLRDHPLEVAIVLFTPPFLPASLQATRVFRLLRLARLLRLGKLTRRVFSTEGVRDAAVFAVMTVVGGGAAFAAVESDQHLSAWDGVWWAMTTVTTVGYGDISPHTDSGRVIAIAVMIVGIGFIALLTAAAAHRFLRPTIEQAEEDVVEHIVLPEAEVLRRLDEISARLGRLERATGA
jgi:voltage-gated potassium channel